MKIKIICVGKPKEKAITMLENELLKRTKIEISETKDSNINKEGEKIIELLDKTENKFIFILSEEGKQFSSVELSQKLQKISLEGKQILFIIGGPYGLSDAVKKKADIVLSLSKMTFTHEMARLFLIEQIYRAVSIIENKKYHK
ncbi:MAG: 23S rRNA (pseudouridine(1915)-N(3))-methyltransferase RlmH [archaeon]